MNGLFKRIILYAKLPEMQLFWFLFPIILVLLIVSKFYLPTFIFTVFAGVFLALIILIVFIGLRLAKLNMEVKTERNQLKSIIVNFNDGVIVYDPNFKILIFNKAAERIFNLESNEIIGQIISPDKIKEQKFNFLAQVIFPSLAPLVVKRSDSGVYPQITDISLESPKAELRVITDRIIDSNGQLLGFVKLIHNRTREIELMKSKNEFISVAAHQLRTPLSGINWFFEEILKENLTENQKQMVDQGAAAMTKILKTVNDLLDISKIEEGKFGYKFENINIIEFIEDLLSQVNDFIKISNVKIYFDKPAEQSIIISIDRNKLSMAFFNLIDNAARYNVKNGEIRIGIEKMKDESYILIKIKDTGVGIPKEEMPKLFGKFFRAENASKFFPEGTGLGLYIVKNIIKGHGGKIWAESELNRGSTFYFTLPTDQKLIPSREVFYEEE